MPVGSRIPGLPSGPPVGPRLVADKATALGFVPVEYDSIPKTSVIGPDGTCEIDFGPVPMDRVWHIQRISVSSTSGTTTIASVYLDSADPANLVDLSTSGNGDIADEVSPILVSSGQKLLIVWNGGTVGASCSARVQIEAGHIQQLPIPS